MVSSFVRLETATRQSSYSYFYRRYLICSMDILSTMLQLQPVYDFSICYTRIRWHTYTQDMLHPCFNLFCCRYFFQFQFHHVCELFARSPNEIASNFTMYTAFTFLSSPFTSNYVVSAFALVHRECSRLCGRVHELLAQASQTVSTLCEMYRIHC